ncbi:capsule assembly Wzi family protein [Emticicia sp. W12TSBA100-4]|uniref:capsule assembly Wzi family protein n=1 Tax=Emticicia sp. W12TSBA100-4 TaxID=3160965 RepID=UPI003305A1C6
MYISTSNQPPFWLRSNQYGIVPVESPFLTVRGTAHKEYDSTINQQNQPKKFSYGYGLNSIVNVGKSSQILLPEAYIKLRYGAFEFYGGRRREIFGLVDSSLTSGSYIWSGNALPIPKAQISIPNYTSIIGHGVLSIKGGYAHGWFGHQGDVKNYFLHQKWLYGRIGKPNWKMKFYGGFNHQVQWGGKPINPYIEQQTGKIVTNYGNDFKTYINVVTGVSLLTKGGLALDGVPINEAWNRAGNHLGTIDIATEINFNSINLFIYRQNIYEDGSLFFLNNISDGLLGLSLVRKNIQNGIIKICFEYLITTSQGGNLEEQNDVIPQLRGNDNYFNNGIYTNGWAYKSNIIGTPLITPLNQIENALISSYDLSEVPNSYIVNNRLNAYNISLSGKILKLSFTTKLMWSNNFGIYVTPFSAKQFSFMQQVNYQLPKYTLVSSLSIDKGKLYSNNLGLHFGVRRTFL